MICFTHHKLHCTERHPQDTLCGCMGFRRTLIGFDIKPSGNLHAVYGPCVCVTGVARV